MIEPAKQEYVELVYFGSAGETNNVVVKTRRGLVDFVSINAEVIQLRFIADQIAPVPVLLVVPTSRLLELRLNEAEPGSEPATEAAPTERGGARLVPLARKTGS